MKRPFAYRLVVFALALMASGCTSCARQQSVSVTPNPAPGSNGAASDAAIDVSRLRVALPPDWFTVEHEAVSANPSELVLLIGENHASVSAQENLALLLERLVEKNLIDAVLIEGSNGPIQINQQAVIPDARGAAQFWRGKLRWGQLAGYEYVALRHPALPIHGVEDMTAKMRFAISEVTSVSQEDLDHVVDLPRRGKAALESAAARLREARPGENHDDLQGLIELLGTAVDSLAVHAATFAKVQQPSVQLQLELLKVANEVQTLLAEVRPALEEAEKQTDEFNALLPDYQRDVEEYKRLLSAATSTGGDGLLGRLTMLRESIEQKGGRLKELKAQIDSVEQSPRLRRLEAYAKKQKELTTLLDAEPEAVAGPAASFERVQDDAIDLYFRAANQLRRRIETTWNDQAVPQTVRTAMQSVDRFFDSEARRARAAGDANAIPRLLERDRAMAANTAAYIRETRHRRVALIIGYAHMPGMIKQLQDKAISFVGGGLKGNDSNERWESEAWDQRRSPRAILTRGSAAIKELSLLLNRLWQAESVATLNLLREIRPPAGTPVVRRPSLTGAVNSYDAIGERGDKVMLVSKYFAGPQASLSPHVLARGPVPESPSEVFQVLDRSLAAKTVRENTDDVAEFMYLFRRSQAGNPEYRVITPAGEIATSGLAGATAGKSPRYRVVEVEPDFTEESGGVVSPGGRAIALAGGSGGGGNDKPPNPFSPLYGEGGERRGVGVFLTTNMERAKDNVKKLHQQKPLGPDDVRFSEGARSLIDMPFATRDGEAAGLVVLLARNTQEFRAAIAEASAAQKLRNKQVALITCGDAFVETAELRESILQGGALLVWTPQRQLTPEAGRRVQDRTFELLQSDRYRDVDDLMRTVVRSLDADITVGPVLRDATTHTEP